MATAGQISSLLDGLPNCANKVETLKDLKTLLLSTSSTDIASIARNVSFDVVFDCLNTDDSEQITGCCDVLSYILSFMDPASMLEQFQEDMLLGIHHTEIRVQHLCLEQICRVADDAPQRLLQYPAIISQLIQKLGSGYLGIAKRTAQTLIMLCGTMDGLETLLTGESQVQLQRLLEGSEVIRLRIYELIVDIARLNAGAWQYCSSSGLLPQLVNEIYKDDILLQLNCLQLLTRLATFEHGLVFMDQQGVLEKLDNMLESIDSDPLSGFLLPGLVKFFGNVAHLHPKDACNRFPHFMDMLFNLVDSENQTQQVLAIETLTHIGETAQGKMILEKHSRKVCYACRTAGQLAKNLTSELKLRTLNALAKLFHLELADQTAELVNLTEFWFKSLAPSPMDHLLGITRLPFTDIRCATFGLLQSIAAYPWGQKTMNLHPGFNEYILDRSTENQKECKERKFDVVKTLVESPTAMEIFGRVYYVRLKEFYNEGPFYVKVEAAVAMESAD